MKINLELTESEAGHLLNVLAVNEREGWYFGNPDQYWKRASRIKTKLSNPMKPQNTFNAWKRGNKSILAKLHKAFKAESGSEMAFADFCRGLFRETRHYMNPK